MKDKMAEVEEQPAAAANGNGAHTVDSEVYTIFGAFCHRGNFLALFFNICLFSRTKSRRRGRSTLNKTCVKWTGGNA